MSSNVLSRSTHSHVATKTNKSTNIINHDTNTISSDRTLTHVNDGQGGRVEGGRTHKHRRSEVAPVVHKAMVSHGLSCCCDHTLTDF